MGMGWRDNQANGWKTKNLNSYWAEKGAKYLPALKGGARVRHLHYNHLHHNHLHQNHLHHNRLHHNLPKHSK